MESTEERNGVMLGTWGDDGYVLYNISAGNVNTSVDITAWDASNGYAEPVWTNTHAHQVNDVNSPVSMTSSAEHLTFASGAYAWSVDIDSGELIESLPATRWTTANRFHSTTCSAVAPSRCRPGRHLPRQRF